MYKDLNIYRINGNTLYQGITKDNVKINLTRDEALKVALELRKENNGRDNHLHFLNKKEIKEIRGAKVTPEAVKNFSTKAAAIAVAGGIALSYVPLPTFALEEEVPAYEAEVVVEQSNDDKETTNSNTGESTSSTETTESVVTESTGSTETPSNETTTTETTEPAVTETNDAKETTEVVTEGSEVVTDDGNTVVTDSTEVTPEGTTTVTEGSNDLTNSSVIVQDYVEPTTKEEYQQEEKEYNGLIDEGEKIITIDNEYCAPVFVISYNDFSATTGKKAFENYGTMTEEEFRALWEKSYEEGINQLYNEYITSDRNKPVDICKIINDKEGKELLSKYEEFFYMIRDCKNETYQAQLINYFCEMMREDLHFIEKEECVSFESITRYEYAVEIYTKIIEKYTTNTKVTKENKKLIKHMNKYFKEHRGDLCPSYGYGTNYGTGYGYEESYDNYERDYNKTTTNKKKHKKKKIVVKWKTGKQIIREVKVEKIVKVRWEKICKIKEIKNLIEVDKWKETQTKHWEESTITNTTDEEKARELVGDYVIDKLKEEIQKKIDFDNQKEKEKAEAEADKTAEEMQKIEDEKAEKIREEVAKDDKDMQDKINEANEKIENGETVNEKDFGDHNVKFNEEVKDKDGNLNSSVKDITTDGTGAVSHDTELPDPQKQGEEFDKTHKPTDGGSCNPSTESNSTGSNDSSSSTGSNDSSSSTGSNDSGSSTDSGSNDGDYVTYETDNSYTETTSSEPKTESSPAPKVESAPAPKAEPAPAPKVESTPAPSNESVADAYVESMAEGGEEKGEGKTK